MSDIQNIGRNVIATEIAGLEKLRDFVASSGEFVAAVEMIANCRGRIILTGIGKSGHIARKISATLASTGTPSYFMHAAEANHGDLGLITIQDVVIAISNSGETAELVNTLEYCRRFSVPMIGITSRGNSTLANLSSIALVLPKAEEACIMRLAPTTSTTLTLALGDALAVSAMQLNGFTEERFHVFHPGGTIGQLLTRASEIMHKGDAVPVVGEGTSLGEAIVEMTGKRLGCVGVVSGEGALVGIFTDGDLRRNLAGMDMTQPIGALMTRDPRRVGPDEPVASVANLLSRHRIPSVFVCDGPRPVGIIHFHDLLSRGLV